MTADGAGVCGVVQHVRIEVDAVRPDYGARLAVDRNLREEARVLERSEHPLAAVNPGREVDDTTGPVGEREGQSKRANHLHFADSRQHGLLQGIDPRWRLIGMKAAPVFEQLGPVDCSPFDDQGQGAWRQRPSQKTDRVDPDLGFGPGIGRVEVGRVVIEEDIRITIPKKREISGMSLR